MLGWFKKKTIVVAEEHVEELTELMDQADKKDTRMSRLSLWRRVAELYPETADYGHWTISTRGPHVLIKKTR